MNPSPPEAEQQPVLGGLGLPPRVRFLRRHPGEGRPRRRATGELLARAATARRDYAAKRAKAAKSRQDARRGQKPRGRR